VAGVDVDEDAVELELAVEHRDEAAGQRALMDDCGSSASMVRTILKSRARPIRTPCRCRDLESGREPCPETSAIVRPRIFSVTGM